MAPVQREQLSPIHVVAHLAEGVVLRSPLMLDALLIWATAARQQTMPPLPGAPVTRWSIPIARDTTDRFYLCSEGMVEADVSELRYKSRRPIFSQLARLGASSIRRMDTAAGANKQYRAPYERQLLAGSRIEWWCLGYAEQIRELLGLVRYVGRFRGSGSGRLDIHGKPWTVETCEPWEGFPVVRDGRPLRPLPPDHPRVSGGRQSFRVLEPPYWDLAREELLICP